MTEMYVEPTTTGRGNADDLALSVSGLEKIFGSRRAREHASRSGASTSQRQAVFTQALSHLSFEVRRGEFVSIMGPSGSGKTTLLNCISTIDRPTSGTIIAGGKTITTMNRRQLAAFRRQELGFIFQDANLLDTLTGAENVALALTIRHEPPRAIADRVRSIAEVLGVADVLDKYPAQMSGGQRQRLAAARAMVAHPSLILADEPTGALDSRNAMVMLETLERMNRLMSATILMVTHDAFAASYSSRVLFLKDGRLFNELRRGTMAREAFFSRIMEVITFLNGDATLAAPDERAQASLEATQVTQAVESVKVAQAAQVPQAAHAAGSAQAAQAAGFAESVSEARHDL